MIARLFPLALLAPGTFQLWPVGTLIGGGASLAGPGQTVDWSGGGWWAGELGAIRVSKPDQHRTLRALLMHAAHGGEIVMPILDDPQRPMEPSALGSGVARFNDGARFSDGGVFRSGRIAFELAEAAQEGDTEILIRRVTGRPLLGGEYWSFDHPEAGYRAYCIEDLEGEAGGVRRVAFGVPLRTDLAAGAFADFETPRVTMRLASDPKEVWPVIRPPFRSDVSIRFIESFDYL
jgi:hypothetical protein